MRAQRNRFVRNSNEMREMRSNEETGGEDEGKKNNGTQGNNEIKSEGDDWEKKSKNAKQRGANTV